MKYLCSFFFLILLSLGVQAQEPLMLPEQERLQQDLDRMLIDRLVALSRGDHKGKPVGDFLQSEDAKGYTEMLFRYTPTGEIDYLLVVYSPKVFLAVYAADATTIAEPLADPEKALAHFKASPISKLGVRFIMLQEGSSQPTETH